MKLNRLITALLVGVVLFLSAVVFAQVKRPYKNGTVWALLFIRMKPGMERSYMDFVATEWKREQEALKKDGQIVSYKVLATEAHSPADFNLILMSEYKDLATMEANEDKEDALGQQLFGNDQKQMEAYRERLEIREILGDRIAREMILESKQK
jgi:hypothetical protein